MSKFLTPLLFFHGLILLQAQHLPHPALQELVNVEREFIQMAKEKNTRDAFLYFLADSAVTFGKEPRKGKQYLEEQTPGNDWLYWDIAYSDIAASGDFGFNLGPWEYRRNRKDEKPVASGSFISVWRKQADGKWKNVIDIGVSHPLSEEKTVWTTSLIPAGHEQPEKPISFEVFLKEQENAFIQAYHYRGNEAFDFWLSEEARIFRSDAEPFVRAGKETYEKSTQKIQYKPLGGAIAASSDLAYVYGTASLDWMRKEGPQIVPAHYLRIWKKEKNKGWKIVVDVLSVPR